MIDINKDFTEEERTELFYIIRTIADAYDRLILNCLQQKLFDAATVWEKKHLEANTIQRTGKIDPQSDILRAIESQCNDRMIHMLQIQRKIRKGGEGA